MLIAHTGVDTLHLHCVLPLHDGIAGELLELKKRALAERALGTLDDTPVGLTLAGRRLEVRPHGARAGPFFARSDELQLTVNPEGGGDSAFPTVVLELSAYMLAREGWREAAAAAQRVLAELCEGGGGMRAAQVTRLDLCADFTGWVPVPELRDSFIARARRRTTHAVRLETGKRSEAFDVETIDEHQRGRAFSGFSFGGGAIAARLYDKAREILTSRKLWFRPIWRIGGWKDGQPLWRLEFQLRREFLREAAVTYVTPDGVDTGRLVRDNFCSWEGCASGLPTLWRYLSTRWLSYRDGRTGRTRQRINPAWEHLVTQARFDGGAPAVDLYRAKRGAQQDATLAQLSGYLKRRLLDEWENAREAGFRRPMHLTQGDALMSLVTDADAYHRRKHGRSIVRAAAEKQDALAELIRLHCAGAPPLH